MRNPLALLLIVLGLGAAGVAQEAEPAPRSEPAAPSSAAAAPTSGAAAAPVVGGVTTGAVPNPLGPAFATGGNVAVIPIRGDIYDFTLESLKYRVERALDNGATVIVIEIETNGGLAPAALDIAKYVKTIPVPTVAWVNDQAYSAGVIIATACNAVVMSPASAMGDAAPVVPGMTLAPTERAKALSPVIEELRDNARAHRRDFAPLHAMVELGVRVYFIEHTQTGERRLVNQADYELMVNGREPTAAPAADPNADPNAPIIPVESVVATDADRAMWKPVTTLPSGANLPHGLFHDGRTLLTMNQVRAQDVGLSQATVRNEAELTQLLGAANVQTYSYTWSQQLASWVTHPIMKGLFVIMLMMGVYIELQAPGFGVGGVMALVALAALLGAPFVIGAAEVWHVLLILAGLALLLAEVFVTPGFGVLGIAGLVCMCVGLIVIGVPPAGGGGIGGAMPAPEFYGLLQASAVATLLALVASGFGAYFLTKSFGRLPVLNRLILASDPLLTTNAGRVVAADGTPIAGPALPVSGDDALGGGLVKLGDTGVVTTILRPSGRAAFGDTIADVITEAGYVDLGQRVRVVAVDGNRILVEPV